MSLEEQQLERPLRSGEMPALRAWARLWVHDHPVAGVHPDDVALAVTELVTNAMLHGAGPVDLELEDGPATVRVSVGDSSDLAPQLPGPDGMALGGRGLMILGGLGRWGVDPRPEGGKTVWCELSSS